MSSIRSKDLNTSHEERRSKPLCLLMTPLRCVNFFKQAREAAEARVATASFKRHTAVALKLLVTPSELRRKAAWVYWLKRQKPKLCAQAQLLFVHFCAKRKFLAGRILEVPLIVLQYYKPSFSIYPYLSFYKYL